MTDVIRLYEAPTRLTKEILDFSNYNPDWSRNTMNTVNELTSQFYGWFEPIPKTSQGDYITWGLLGFIALVLLFKK